MGHFLASGRHDDIRPYSHRHRHTLIYLAGRAEGCPVRERLPEYSRPAHVLVDNAIRDSSGPKAKNVDRQRSAFERFCAANSILYLTDEVVVKAADIYADLYQRGELIGDADILIAATAIVADYNLATNNERHFSRISDLRVENWLRSS